MGGPQPAFCDLEEHNALTAHQERRRLANEGSAGRASGAISRPSPGGGAAMANEAYRAVFLRVHPTGKMVLSLTTESDGNEAEYAQLVADELGVPALDVKVVPADTDRFGDGHGLQHQPVRRYARRDRHHRGEDPCEGAAARGRGAGGRPGEPQVGQRGLGRRRRTATPTQVKTIEDIALYAHGTGALPPGVEGGLDAQTVYRD